MLLLGGFSSCAQEAPKAIDLGVSVKWAAKDIGPEADITRCPRKVSVQFIGTFYMKNPFEMLSKGFSVTPTGLKPVTF